MIIADDMDFRSSAVLVVAENNEFGFCVGHNNLLRLHVDIDAV